MTTQLDASIGAKVESTFGTAVTVDRWWEFTDESLDWDPTFVQGAGLRVGRRVARASRRALGKQQVSGDFTIEACSKGMGLLLNAALGSVTSTLISGTAYQQVHTPTVSDYLPSYTFQKGVPPLGGGAAVPHTFPGMMCSTLEIDVPNSDLATVKTSWIGREVNTATAYAAPSYPTPVELFSFVGGAITLGGTVTAPTTTALATGGTAVADISDFNISWDNKLDDGGFNLGGGGKLTRKKAVGLAEAKGKLTAEFDANTLRDAYLNQTDLGLVLTLSGVGIISGAIVPTLQIYIPDIRLEGELPKVGSTDGSPVTQSIDFTVLDNLSAAAPLYIVYVTSDVAV